MSPRTPPAAARRSTAGPRATPATRVSQRLRKRIEEAFGWIKTVGGFRKTRHRGTARVGWLFTLDRRRLQPGPLAQAAGRRADHARTPPRAPPPGSTGSPERLETPADSPSQHCNRRKCGADQRPYFRSLLSCSQSSPWADGGSPAGAEVGWRMAKRLAGGGVSRRRLNKLSCAGWLPHDRGFVSGLPRSRGRASASGRLITGDEDSPTGPAARQALR